MRRTSEGGRAASEGQAHRCVPAGRLRSRHNARAPLLPCFALPPLVVRVAAVAGSARACRAPAPASLLVCMAAALGSGRPCRPAGALWTVIGGWRGIFVSPLLSVRPLLCRVQMVHLHVHFVIAVACAAGACCLLAPCRSEGAGTTQRFAAAITLFAKGTCARFAVMQGHPGAPSACVYGTGTGSHHPPVALAASGPTG